MAGIQLGLIGSFPTPVTSSFESIASITASGGETSLTFSSIPSTYQHLQIRGIARASNASSGTDALRLRLNSDSSASYTYHAIRGNGASAIAFGGTAQTYSLNSDCVLQNGGLASTYGVSIIDIQDYASTSRNKTLRTFGGVDQNGSGLVELYSSLWINTSAINSIALSAGSTWIAGTTFSLYGIKA